MKKVVKDVYMSTLSDKNRKKAEETLLKTIKIKCIHCHGKMIRVVDLYDDAIIGYSCQDCPHYNFLN